MVVNMLTLDGVQLSKLLAGVMALIQQVTHQKSGDNLVKTQRYQAVFLEHSQEIFLKYMVPLTMAVHIKVMYVCMTMVVKAVIQQLLLMKEMT